MEFLQLVNIQHKSSNSTDGLFAVGENPALLEPYWSPLGALLEPSWGSLGGLLVVYDEGLREPLPPEELELEAPLLKLF